MNIWLSDTCTSNLWFQMKPGEADDSAWMTVPFTRTSNYEFVAPRATNVTCHLQADFNGTAFFRVADTNAAGEHAGWLVIGPVTNHLRHVGTPIGSIGNAERERVFDGIASTIYESNFTWSGTTNPWIGLAYASGVTVRKIRFLPRQTLTTGQIRLEGNVFECADNPDFTDAMRLGDPLPANLALGRAHEITLEQPVTARYFRLLHNALKDPYISIAEIEFIPEGLPAAPAISVACSDDWTNQSASVSWSVPSGCQCPSGTVQRAVSPFGPFNDVSPWVAEGVAGSFTDTTAKIGVRYYYRVKALCEAAYLDDETYSPMVSYVRGKRLDRSWDDLTVMKSGVSVMYPYEHLGKTFATTLTNAWKSFDGDTNTYTEVDCYTNSVRVMNPAVGVDLGSAYHITGAIVLPRNTPASGTLDRARRAAVFGADTSTLSGQRQLSPPCGGFPSAQWQYNAVTNNAEACTCRYVYLQNPNLATFNWYGNVAEVGFFGYTDQDTIDSGVLIPPTEITCTVGLNTMTIFWNAGWNVASYTLQRRVKGESEWATVKSGLPSTTLSCSDGGTLLKGIYEYRIVAVSSSDETIPTPSVECDFNPRRGTAILYR